MTSEYRLVSKNQEIKSGKGNQNNFTRVFPRSDFGKANISYLYAYNFFPKESRPLLPKTNSILCFMICAEFLETSERIAVFKRSQ